MGEPVRADLRLGNMRLEQIGVHRDGVKMCPLDDPLRVSVQGACLVHKASDVGHSDIFSVTKAGVEERGAKQCISHGVERGFKAFVARLDQCEDLWVLVVDFFGLMT